MERFSFLFTTIISFGSQISNHAFLLRCLPRDESCQRLLKGRIIVPDVEIYQGIDSFGNKIAWGHDDTARDTFAFTAEGVVETRPYRVCAAVHPMYRSGTSLTDCSAAMSEFAHANAGNGPVFEQAGRLALVVHSAMTYTQGVTSVHTTASEAFASKTGVCQDYAHILIALCRELGIAARYVTGYMVGEGVTHAWVEIFDPKEGVWLGLDPTNGCTIRSGYIKVAHGRDADDCPVSRGMMTGLTEQQVDISLKVSPA